MVTCQHVSQYVCCVVSFCGYGLSIVACYLPIDCNSSGGPSCLTVNEWNSIKWGTSYICDGCIIATQCFSVAIMQRYVAIMQPFPASVPDLIPSSASPTRYIFLLPKILSYPFPGWFNIIWFLFLLFNLQVWHEYCNKDSKRHLYCRKCSSTRVGASEKGGIKAADYHL